MGASLLAMAKSKCYIQSTPDNSNLHGKSKKVRVIGSSKQMAGSKGKTSFYCTVNILINNYKMRLSI